MRNGLCKLWLFVFAAFIVAAMPIHTPDSEPTFLGFAPKDRDAKLGLEYIFAGRAFRPNGIPFSLVSNLYNLRRFSGQRNISLEAGKDQLEVFGKLPSPPSRKYGLGPSGRDYTLSNSIIELQACRGDEGKKKTEFYPLDAYASDTHCDTASIARKNRAKLWHHNCFQCHAGSVGKYVVGGAHANYSNQFGLSEELKLLASFVDEKTPGKGGSSAFQLIKMAFTRLLTGMNALEKKSLDHFLDYARTELIPTFKWGKSAGDNMGPFTSYKGMARLKPNGDGYRIYKRNEFSPTDSSVYQDNSLFIPTIDAMPWWLLKFKNHVFWTADHSVTKVRQFMYAFTFQHQGIGSSHEPHAKRLGLALRYAEKLHSPAYPFKIDWTLVEKGRKIFHSQPIEKKFGATCSSCHGRYEQTKPNSSSWKVSYPGEMGTIAHVGTDDTYSEVSHHVTAGIQELLAESTAAIQTRSGPEAAVLYGPKISVASPTGVVPPPLVGLWASPPYLHNGSVPTVYHVLRSSERPLVWSRPKALLTQGFDPNHLGFSVKGVDSPVSSKSRRDHLFETNPVSRETSRQMLTYRTREKGRSNQGHTFVDGWPEEDILAILEFLKSLSGPNVLPSDPKNMGVKFSR